MASIDADLQDPPEKIAEMLTKARAEGLDIVYGVRNDRASDTIFKRRTAGLYYWMMRRLAGVQAPANAGDFRLLSRATVDVLRQLPEHQPVYRLLVPWIGFPSGEVTYVRDGRAAGKTKYPLTKMIRLAVDSITNFSAAPLRIATWLGALTFVLTLLLLIYVGVSVALGHTVQGWASVLASVLFLGGVQLLCLGLLGEYLGPALRRGAGPAGVLHRVRLDRGPDRQRRAGAGPAGPPRAGGRLVRSARRPLLRVGRQPGLHRVVA